MSDLPSRAKPDPAASHSEADQPLSELTELRSLLIGSDLKERFDNARLRSEDVSRVLPEALDLTLRREDQPLPKVMVPTVEKAIKSSVSRDQNILSEALFPIMGPAIRKAIAAAIQNLIDSLNQSLEHSLSAQSLSWRFEAWRTGKSFAEVLLLRTLVYQVEQVFLIHKVSGLVLHHLTAAMATVQDADLVSAMFTAIQDFVKDSFSISDEALGSLQVGELTIWVNEGPQALIACVIRGNPPGSLRQTMENALERIHLLYESQLHEFQGENSAFETCRPYLEECLQSQYQAKEKRSPFLKWIGGAVGILLLGWGTWIFLSLSESRQVENFAQQLNQEPGIVVLQTQKQNGKYTISGLRDPLAVRPQDLVAKADLDPDKLDFRWEPYLSFDSKFVASRVRTLLQPPQSVTLHMDTNGVLQMSGSAPQTWINQAKTLALQLPNITQVETQSIVPVERQALDALTQKIESTSIFFTQNTQLVPQQNETLKSLAQDLNSLLQTATTLGQRITVHVEGHTDAMGVELINLYIREMRAEAVISLLVKQGTDPRLLQAVSVEPPPTKSSGFSQSVLANRKVTFKVIAIHPSTGTP
jgi:OOP family OmpA-OmpF porin